MKIYSYDEMTGEYISEGEAVRSPLWNNTHAIEDKFLIPRNATTVAPPDAINGHVRVFGLMSGEWIQVEDNRGKTVYNTSSAASLTLLAIGAIPDGYTLFPPCPYPKWNGSAWETDTEAQSTDEAEKAIQEEIRAMAVSNLIAKKILPADFNDRRKI